MIEIDKADLQALFDVATGSMDFGSGFLDDEEVQMLRRVAVTLGVNPMAGTPYGFRSKYRHDFEGYERDTTVADATGAWMTVQVMSDRCKWCSTIEVDHDAYMARMVR